MTSTCANPSCTCDPCSCADCHCGSARLGGLERQVMEVLWAEPGALLRGRAVADRLPRYAYTTVATVLNRLSQKGQVQRIRQGRSFVYGATGTAGAHAARAMREALEAAQDPADALGQLVAGMSPRELNTLRGLLTDHA